MGKAARGWPNTRLMTILVILAGALGGCDTASGWLGESEGKPLPGERISVLQLEQEIAPDPSIADLAVKLPPPWRNESWPQAAGYATHAMHHLELTALYRIDVAS